MQQVESATHSILPCVRPNPWPHPEMFEGWEGISKLPRYHVWRGQPGSRSMRV